MSSKRSEKEGCQPTYNCTRSEAKLYHECSASDNIITESKKTEKKETKKTITYSYPYMHTHLDTYMYVYFLISLPACISVAFFFLTSCKNTAILSGREGKAEKKTIGHLRTVFSL